MQILACGSDMPAPDGRTAESGGTVRMKKFSLRYHVGGERFVEITGDSAALVGAAHVDMDSAALTFYRDNLAFMTLAASTARAQMDAPDSGMVTLKDVRGRLYYGGVFRMGTLQLFFDRSVWRADTPVEFDRPPLSFVAAEAAGPLHMEWVDAKTARLWTDESSAAGDNLRFRPAQRTAVFLGRAEFFSAKEKLRAGRLTIHLDPTYSRLSPRPFPDGLH